MKLIVISISFICHKRAEPSFWRGYKKSS